MIGKNAQRLPALRMRDCQSADAVRRKEVPDMDASR